MSYQIDSSAYLSGGPLSIQVGEWRRLARELAVDLPEVTFLQDEPPDSNDAVIVPITNFQWHGVGAGYESQRLFIEHVAPSLIGEADILLIWEGGDSYGWRICDGKVTDCDVVTTLVPK